MLHAYEKWRCTAILNSHYCQQEAGRIAKCKVYFLSRDDALSLAVLFKDDKMDPFVGEISLFAFDRTPQGWLPCNGQLLPITQYAALYSLLTITYGGDGKTTFGLPDLRGRVIVGQGHQAAPPYDYTMGLAAGEEGVTLTVSAIPPHTHPLMAVNLAPETNAPSGNLLSQSISNIYAPGSANLQPLASGSVSVTGSNKPHENRQPSMALQFCIATVGLYPQRSW
ncbi:phage tail protein [Pseudomonas sp. LRF_L74]|uniref:phage tail protein n=1 Tax=Pseudomonas sp. LRF_L74 TaxID=3369422 RepID=UPI003F61287A